MSDPSKPPGGPAPNPSAKRNLRRTGSRASDPKRLRARLLTQIERQIDRFEAALNAETPPAGFDPGKVLRDLGGLKNLLDDMRAADRTAREGGTDGASGRSSLSAADLVAMRADIARRYAAFAAAEPDDGILDPALPGASAPA